MRIVVSYSHTKGAELASREVVPITVITEAMGLELLHAILAPGEL